MGKIKCGDIQGVHFIRENFFAKIVLSFVTYTTMQRSFKLKAYLKLFLTKDRNVAATCRYKKKYYLACFISIIKFLVETVVIRFVAVKIFYKISHVTFCMTVLEYKWRILESLLREGIIVFVIKRNRIIDFQKYIKTIL